MISFIRHSAPVPMLLLVTSLASAAAAEAPVPGGGTEATPPDPTSSAHAEPGGAAAPAAPVGGGAISDTATPAPASEAAKVREEPGPPPPPTEVLSPGQASEERAAAAEAGETWPPPSPQLKVESPNGNSIRFGLLLQPQFEAHGGPKSDKLTQNLSLRRISFLIGGTVLKRLDYSFDTDFGDLLKGNTTDPYQRNGPGISVKDAYFTLRAVEDAFKIDAGLIMPPGTHNFLQGSSSLYGWDFFLNTGRANTVFPSTGNPYGRDVGVQLRGLVLGGLLEYRAALLQGKRNPPTATEPEGHNQFRYAGRIQLNFLDPETNYFYAGTYLGKKKIFSVGGSADVQHDDGHTYRALGADAFLELGGVTAQVDILYRNGDTVVALPKQKFLGAEAGYTFAGIKLSPIGRIERRWSANLHETDVGGGLAYWAFGHTSNLKAFYTRLIPESPGKGYDQVNVQYQFYFY